MLRETQTQLYLLAQAQTAHEAAILTLLLGKRFTTQSNQELNNISINLIILIEKLLKIYEECQSGKKYSF